MPLSEAVHDVEATRAALAATSGVIAVTSGEAIRTLERLGAEALAPHLRRPLFAVGKATAEEARAAGFTSVHHSESDGAGLAELLASQSPLLGANPITYLAGQPRAAGLERGLSASGIAFDTVDCYRMESIEPSEAELAAHLRDNPVDAILFYSRHNADLFFGLDFVARQIGLLESIRLLCLSATIAAAIPQALQPKAEIAAIPDEESLLSLLNVGKRPILI